MKYSCDRDRIHLPLLFVCLFFFTLISFYCRDVTFPIFILFYYRDGAFSSLISFYFMWWNISDLDYHFTTVMWLFPPWHHFTTVMDHFVPWPHFTTVMEHFLPEYYFTQYRDRIFSTLIIISLPWCTRPFLLGGAFLYCFYKMVTRICLYCQEVPRLFTCRYLVHCL